MTTDRQRAQWEEKDRIAEVAEKLRRASRQQQAESQVGRVPIVPADRYVFVGFLDELALAAGRGELPRDVRRVGLELCDALAKELDDKQP